MAALAMMPTSEPDPLGLLMSAREEVSYEFAVQQQERDHNEYIAHQKQQEEAEYLSVQLVRRLSQEEEDSCLAERLAERERRAMIRAQQEKLAQEQRDAEAAMKMQELEESEAQKAERERKQKEKEDAELAKRLQMQEEQEAIEAAKQLKMEEVRKRQAMDWEDPKVHCEQDEATQSMRLWVLLPQLGHTQVTIVTEASQSVITIAATNVNQDKTFSFDLKLVSENALNITEQDVKATYFEETSILEVKILGIKMVPAPREDSLVEKLKRAFSFSSSRS
eukprot:TRINITY_DN5091_c0_g2_i6.p1 TRINITY_DN5091_c0_g2~~TRINITY_DN5091_c0_g2_i6.p1  ORF type:complete len:279 (+),score=103.87 TRINITY_DN5091_c0_g2_i6:75-911(+)